MKPSGRRPGRAELVLAVVSLLVFCAGAEGLTRLVDLRPSGGTALANPAWLGGRWLLRRDYRKEMADAGILSRYYELYEWDRYLFYRLRPDVNLELLDVMAPQPLRERTRWSVHTSARGFRGPDFDDRPPPGVVRVAVLGDSSTFGWGVEAFQAYPDRLRSALAERWHLPPERVEVLNLGVPGYSSFQGKVLLERVGLRLAPDVVVWSYLSNDGQATGSDDAATYAQRIGSMGAILAVLHESRAYETLESWIAVARARLRPPPEPDAHDPSQRNVRDYREARHNVREAVDAARAAGVPIVLLAECVRGMPAAVLRSVSAVTNVPFVDGTALLDAAIPRIEEAPRFAPDRKRLAAHWGEEALHEHPYWLAFLPDGCHPNPLGHRLVADALADAVVQALPEAPR
jgi:lysophospholipase L1-like esterase